MERRKIERILVAIQEREQNISIIAKKSKVTKPTVRKMLNILEEQGSINLRKTKKYVYVSITKSGLLERHNLLVDQEEQPQCQMIHQTSIFPNLV